MAGLRPVSCRNTKSPLNTRVCVGWHTSIKTTFPPNSAALRSIELISASTRNITKAKSLIARFAQIKELRLLFGSSTKGKKLTVVVRGDPRTMQYFVSMYYYLALSVKPNSPYSFKRCLWQIMHRINPAVMTFVRTHRVVPPILYLQFANGTVTVSATSNKP